jgi:hypothetical protein
MVRLSASPWPEAIFVFKITNKSGGGLRFEEPQASGTVAPAVIRWVNSWEDRIKDQSHMKLAHNQPRRPNKSKLFSRSGLRVIGQHRM